MYNECKYSILSLLLAHNMMKMYFSSLLPVYSSTHYCMGILRFRVEKTVLWEGSDRKNAVVLALAELFSLLVLCFGFHSCCWHADALSCCICFSCCLGCCVCLFRHWGKRLGISTKHYHNLSGILIRLIQGYINRRWDKGERGLWA